MDRSVGAPVTTTAEAPIHLNAAGRRVQVATLGALAVVAVSSFVVAYPGLVWVGVELAALPMAIALVLPLAIDAGMLTAGLAAAVRRSQRRPARLELALLLGLVGVSVIAQITHVVAARDQWSPLMAVGALVAAAAPVTLLMATEAVLRSVLSEAPARRRLVSRRAERQTSEASAARTAPASTATVRTRERGASTAPRPTAGIDLAGMTRDERLAHPEYAAQLRAGASQNELGRRFGISKTTVGGDREALDAQQNSSPSDRVTSELLA